MERVAPARPGTSRWSLPRSGLVALGFMIILAATNWPLLWWSVQAAVSAPLTLLALLAMLLLPGLALLRLFWRGQLSPAERWPLAIGLSTALPPLILLASAPLGVRWSAPLCWGYLAFSALALLWPLHPAGTPRQARRVWSLHPLDYTNLLLIGITLVSAGARLYPVRDLPAGLWGDSYHHTVIAQLLVDNGGLFSSWRPYAPLRTFTYHFGFHSNVAWLSWLSGISTTDSLLLVGQLQSALAAPLIFLLVRRLTDNDRAALWAALLVAFVSMMPAYYVNWGRYTQLGGQTILPAVCVCWMGLLDRSVGRDLPDAAVLREQQSRSGMSQVQPTGRSAALRASWPVILLTTLASAGLALTHYRVAVFAACFVLAYGLYTLVAYVRTPRTFGRLAGLSLLTGGLTLLLVTPWILRVREGTLLRLSGYYLSQNIGTDQSNMLPSLNQFFDRFASPYLIILACVGLGLLLWMRQWRSLALGSWGLLLGLAANPYLIGLNGAGLLTNFAVLIAGYLVLAPLAGIAVALLCDFAARRALFAQVLLYAQLISAALLVVWGLGWQARIIDPQSELLTPADIQAMAWIRSATPADARFFVNSFPAYGGSLYAGSDGGWWLPLLGRRQSNLPPLLYGAEAAEQPDYQQAVNTQNSALRQHPITAQETVAALRAAGYSYLYDGPAAAPPGEWIDPAALAQSPFYELVYSHDGVTIWKVRL